MDFQRCEDEVTIYSDWEGDIEGRGADCFRKTVPGPVTGIRSNFAHSHRKWKHPLFMIDAPTPRNHDHTRTNNKDKLNKKQERSVGVWAFATCKFFFFFFEKNGIPHGA